LVCTGNHKPEIGNIDDAMKRRIHHEPFVVKPATVGPSRALPPARR
jgi:phage/plasmid-associated DNA primase